MEEVKTLNLQLSAEHWALLIREAEHDDVLLKDSIAAILLSAMSGASRRDGTDGAVVRP
jgi:hypothetical protein